MEFYEAVRLNALHAVHNKDDDYYLRFIFRWYSKTFHTPLHMVDDLPLIDVITAYYEEMYEKMDEDALIQEKYKSSMTPEEWAEKLRKEEEEDLAFMETMMSKQKVENVKTPLPKMEIVEVPKEEGFSLSFADVPI
jgi:hypothetical protein